MSSYVEECVVNFLTIDHALQMVPPEFSQAYNWFIDQTGKRIPALPMGKHIPAGFNHPLARQSGIYTPSYKNLPSGGAGKRKYALSIHSQGHSYYDDAAVIHREDGTWIFDYKAHKRHLSILEEFEESRDQGYNEQLRNCMQDGVPVGVMIKQNDVLGGYLVLGLAYIEKYNKLTDTFTLHGPVNQETENSGQFLRFDKSELSNEQIEALLKEDDEDRETRVLTQSISRQQQGAFRQKILNAYEGTCAITGIDIPEVLQAAHIDPYRGPKSQIVCNGMLFRADIHLLYDANLATVEPATHIFRVAPTLKNSDYGDFDGAAISLPRNRQDRPNDILLDIHHKQFCMQNEIAI